MAQWPNHAAGAMPKSQVCEQVEFGVGAKRKKKKCWEEPRKGADKGELEICGRLIDLLAGQQGSLTDQQSGQLVPETLPSPGALPAVKSVEISLQLRPNLVL